MRHSLFRISNTGAGSTLAVKLLLMQSLLTGIFCGAFDIAAHSIFLSFFDVRMMARAYILSGFVCLILTIFCLKLQHIARFSRLSVVCLLLISVLTSVLWIFLVRMPSGWVRFLVFLMFGPVNIIALLVFHQTSFRLLQYGTGKTLDLTFNAVFLTGILVISVSIPLLISFGLNTVFFILISAVSVILSAVLQIFIVKDQSESDRGDENSPARSVEKSLISIREKGNYMIPLAIFTILPVLVALFIQYSFMAETRNRYPGAEEMAHFLGLFTGCTVIFTMIIKFFAFPFIIRSLRLRTSLVISPVLIAIITSTVIITFVVHRNNSIITGTPAIFVLLVLSRFFSGSLQESVELPSRGILLQVLNRDVRFVTESILKSVVNGAGLLIAGLLLTGIGMIQFVKPAYFPAVLLGLTFLWIIFALKFHNVYRDYVKDLSIRSVQEETREYSEQYYPHWNNSFIAEMEFAYEYPGLITGDLSSVEKYRNQWYAENILRHADIKKDINLLPALKKIRSGPAFPRQMRLQAAEIIKDLEFVSGGKVHKDERLKAMLLLSGETAPQGPEVLKLLRDKDNDLRIIALALIRKFNMHELLGEVCECLGNPDLERQAENVLRSFKEQAILPLRKFYSYSSGDLKISHKILGILGKNCGRENIGFILPVLWTASRMTREKALNSFKGSVCDISSSEKESLMRFITDVFGIISWNLSAMVTIGRTDNRLLKDALTNENIRWLNYLFSLLSLTYGERPVKEIRENLDSGTVRGVNHALEMIDIIFDEQVKVRMRILFENTSDHIRIRNLSGFYPGEIQDFKDLVMGILNRDYNLLGIWIRTCTIKSINRIMDNDTADSLIALLFSPELILRQETINLLSRSGKEYLQQASDRIPEEMKGYLEKIISRSLNDNELLFNKVLFLTSCFKNVPEEYLLYLAKDLRFTDFLSPGYLPREGGYILWHFNQDNVNPEVKLSNDNILRSLKMSEEGDYYYILPVNTLKDFIDQYSEYSDVIFTYIDEIERRDQ